MLKAIVNSPVRSGDQTIVNGDLIVGTAGEGVNFNANTPAAGMTSQLLNWYEEGAWTPTLATTGTNFASVTYAATNGGRYVRVGRIVHLTGYLRTDAVDKTGATGVIVIGGLPFTSASSTGSTRDAWCAVTLGTVFNWLSNQPSEAYIQSGTARIDLLYRTTANGASADLAIADVATGVGGNALAINVSYLAA